MRALISYLQSVLDDEHAGADQFCPLSEDYYEKYRQQAQTSIGGIDPRIATDRVLFAAAKEVYDLCDDIRTVRWTKINRVAINLLKDGTTSIPENLIPSERDYLESVLMIRVKKEGGTGS